MKNEFALAFNEVLEEKQLPKDIILKALESAMVSAYRRAVNASNAQQVEASVDADTGKIVIFAEKEVVETVGDERTEVTLQEAQRYNPDAELGMLVIVESTPADFGRVAAQTARQVIQQRIRDAERQAQMAHFQKQLGEIISGIVQAVSSQGLTIGMDMRAEGIMARKDMIPGERFRIHDRVRALIAEVKDSPRGPQIILSRTHRDFLRRLLENEVPEIYHGVVEIRSIAREPGERAKVAVSASQNGIDPVGACVGIRGVRIQAIVRELHDEKIDVIEWNNDAALFIAKAISPARVVGVYLNDKPGTGKTATVVVPEDQLSLAIGRDGQNARLAAKLTAWRIDIKSISEASSDALYKLENEEAFAEIAIQEKENIPQIQHFLAKKSEGRPLTPEEYDQLATFIDRVERRSAQRQKIEDRSAVDQKMGELRQAIPSGSFDLKVLDSGLPEHVAYILQEAGILTVGEMVLQYRMSPDNILRLQGIGPKAMSEINHLIESLEEKAKTEVLSPVIEPVAVVAVAEPEVIIQAIEPEQIPEPESVAEVITLPDTLQPVDAEPEKSFEEMFTLKEAVVAPAEVEEEEEEGEGVDGDKKKKEKKKKRRFVEYTYDPDRDVVTSQKKHKRDGTGWEW
jgi:N utilization substance protein A